MMPVKMKIILPGLEDYATDWQECQTSGQPSPTSPFRDYFLNFHITHSKMKLSVLIIHALNEIKFTSPKNSFLPKMSLRDKCL